MQRKLRHINARSDEWVVVHRAPTRQAGHNLFGCLIYIIIIAVLLKACS